MLKYSLKEDRLIGHDLIVQRKGLFKKEFSLKGVSYNQLIKNIFCEMEEVSIDSLYQDIRNALKNKIEYNIVNNLSLKNGGNAIGKTKLEKRVNNLKFKFTNLYLKRALNILEENKEN